MPRKSRTLESTKSDFERALKLIEARCGEFDFGVGTIATDLSCSERQVQRIFATNGSTVRERLFSARMKRGAYALADRQTVQRAADLSGYQRPRHFATAFRRHYGLRPSDVQVAAKYAAKLDRRSKTPPPDPRTPQLSKYVKAWRQDHNSLIRRLRGRHRGTILDEIFASAIAHRGPDLRTPDGKATVAALRSPRTRRGTQHFASQSSPTAPGGVRTTSKARPRTPAGRT